jgi:serine kinase of HPr protein (carbohydrate metabolism regulator)
MTRKEYVLELRGIMRVAIECSRKAVLEDDPVKAMAYLKLAEEAKNMMEKLPNLLPLKKREEP